MKYPPSHIWAGEATYPSQELRRAGLEGAGDSHGETKQK